MGELANCPRCNAIFMKGTALVCATCKKKEDQDFQTVYTFMRKKTNRMASVEEIEVQTGVSAKQIRTFVAQKRLHPAQFPNLTYSCEKCGKPIREGRLCSACKEEISGGLEQLDRNKELEKRKKELDAKKSRTYYSVKDE